jgi:hypothetical protein
MNARIQELAEQAAIICIESSPGKLVPRRDFGFEKVFAELLIQEFVERCEQVAADADAMAKSDFVTDAGRMLHQGAWGGAMNCSAEIKKLLES